MTYDKTVLVVAIGNSTVRIAVMRGTAVLHRNVAPRPEFEATDERDRVLAAAEAAGAREVLEAAVICSVVPSLTVRVAKALQDAAVPAVWTVSADAVDWMPVRYAPPASLGADRLCVALALRDLHGAPGIAIDFGTATTVNVIDEQGAFVGGQIVPGISTALKALASRTAMLPDVPADMQAIPPLIGGTTIDAIRAGVVWQAWFHARETVQALSALYDVEPRVVLTGGHAARIASIDPAFLRSRGWHVDEDLLCRGASMYAHHLLFRERSA